jgi:hypothetical protein
MHWPSTAKAQRSGKIYKIGFVTAGGIRQVKNVFAEALSRLGWIEGKNVVYEARISTPKTPAKSEIIAILAAPLSRGTAGPLSLDAISCLGAFRPSVARARG